MHSCIKNLEAYIRYAFKLIKKYAKNPLFTENMILLKIYAFILQKVYFPYF